MIADALASLWRHVGQLSIYEAVVPPRLRRWEGVDLLARYSNTPDLLADLRTTWRVLHGPDDEGDDEPGLGGRYGQERRSPEKITERLRPADLEALIGHYRAGRTIRQLAEEFLISESSVKRVLREAGVRRTPGYVGRV
jgi:hypothetical protein